MKAAVLKALNKIGMEDRERPAFGEYDVLVRTTVTGICTSDVAYATVPGQLDSFPRVLGHETAGWIEAVGDKVRHLAPGQRVVVDPVQSDPNSYYVVHGEGNLDLSSVTGISYDGGFGEFFRSHSLYVHPLPDSVSFEAAASIEPAACSLHAVDMTGLQPGETVVVVGDGPTGILQCQLAKAEGAGTVFLIGAHDFRLERAQAARGAARGADHIINVRDPKSKSYRGDEKGIASFIRSRNSGLLPRRVIVTARGAGQTLGWSLGGPGSVVAYFNLPRPDDNFTIPQLDAMLNEKQYRTAWLAPGKQRTWPRTIAHLASGKLDVSVIQTHRDWALERLYEGVSIAKEGKNECIKVLIRLREDADSGR